VADLEAVVDLAAGVVLAGVAVVAGTDFQMKTIANRRVSRANRAGNFGNSGSTRCQAARLSVRCIVLWGGTMTTTFLKRQKEMKRMEKAKMKEQKRAQRKMEKAALKESGQDGPQIATPTEIEDHSE
jgi:hypothetical protein